MICSELQLAVVLIYDYLLALQHVEFMNFIEPKARGIDTTRLQARETRDMIRRCLLEC